MKRFIEGQERDQATLFPECLEDWVDEDNPIRVIDAFIDSLDLGALGFLASHATAGFAPFPSGTGGHTTKRKTIGPHTACCNILRPRADLSDPKLASAKRVLRITNKYRVAPEVVCSSLRSRRSWNET
jgi:hypothetical protein